MRKSAPYFLRVPFFVSVFFFAAITPSIAFASTVTDLANAIKSLPLITQNSMISNDPALALFLGNPTTVTFAGLNGSTISTTFNMPSMSTLIPTLDPNVLSSLSSGTLTTALSGLTTTVLQSFSPTTFSALPNSTMSTLLSTLPNTTLSNLSSSLLTGLSSGNLSSVLSSLSPSILGSLSPTLFANLSASTISNLLSGSLSSTVLSNLGGSLLGNLSSGTLTSVLGSLSTSALGSLPTTLFSSVSPSIMTALPSSITSALPSSISSLIPGIGGIGGLGGGGVFVPVKDFQLNAAFAAYSAKFSTYASDMKNALTAAPDSLRNIIAGPNPGGVAMQTCKMGTYEMYPYTLQPYTSPAGPWQRAIVYAQSNPALGLDPLPSVINPEVNASASIRCILQDLVGYQKISLFVQIQSMLKQYISDAQQKELSNQLLNQIHSANLNWAKRGEQVTSGTTQSSESVYVQNTTASAENENARIADTIVAQSTAADGDPIGSFGLNDPLYVATQVASNMRDQTENPRDAFAESIRPNITGAEVDAYMDNANTQTGSGAYFMLGDMFKNIQNTPLGAAALVRSEAERRVAEETARREKGEANTGFRPTKKCSGDPADPFCDPAFMIDVSPAGQNLETVVSAIQSGNQQIADSVSLDTGAADAAAGLSNEANTGDGGIAGYDTTALGASKTPVDSLIYELYNTIDNAYFDLNPDQVQWSQAALLMIYDEMEFNPTKPQVILPSDSGSDVPIIF